MPRGSELITRADGRCTIEEKNRESHRGETVIVKCGSSKTSCGYCGSSGQTSSHHAMWADSITVDDYQNLIDQGWSRSGRYLYKMEMEQTCCPTYTIRLKASDFTPSKNQIRALKKMQMFLDGSLDLPKSMEVLGGGVLSDDHSHCPCRQGKNSDGNDRHVHKSDMDEKEEKFIKYMSEQVDYAILKSIDRGKLPGNVKFPKASVKMAIHSNRKTLAQDAGELVYSSNISFQIAAALKAVQTDNIARGEDKRSRAIAKELAETLESVSEANRLASRACNGHLNFYTLSKQNCPGKNDSVARACQEDFKRCYNKAYFHNNITGNLKGNKRKMEILLNRSTFDPVEYALYKKYQIQVHNDTPDRISENSYRRHLVDSPLIYVPASVDGRAPACGFGSFHQQYVIDGHLLGVCVMDVLPNGLSSNYFFYDPDFSFLSIGKYSALQEIDWVKRNQVNLRNFEYYYLGYYIHSCSKMNYKAGYRPSELLCPLRYQWIHFDIARPLLDKNSYAVLSDAIGSESEASALDTIDADTPYL